MSKSPETRPQKAEIYPRGQRKWGKAGAPAANRKILVVIKKRNSTRQGHAVFFGRKKEMSGPVCGEFSQFAVCCRGKNWDTCTKN